MRNVYTFVIAYFKLLLSTVIELSKFQDTSQAGDT